MKIVKQMTNERAVEILNLDLDILGQYGDETAEAYKMAIKALEQQPKTAQWEMIGTIGLAFKCSRCLENSIKNSNYCPNCGAKMEK